MIAIPEGGAGQLHNITIPTSGRGGMQSLDEVERVAKPVKRCQENRKDWAMHWQCDTKVQLLEDSPWENEELRSLEEGLPSLREDKFQRAARDTRPLLAWAVTGFTPMLRWTCQKKREVKL